VIDGRNVEDYTLVQQSLIFLESNIEIGDGPPTMVGRLVGGDSFATSYGVVPCPCTRILRGE
jgi:hypothetical protein